jgi:hypothetical protein
MEKNKAAKAPARGKPTQNHTKLARSQRRARAPDKRPKCTNTSPAPHNKHSTRTVTLNHARQEFCIDLYRERRGTRQTAADICMGKAHAEQQEACPKPRPRTKRSQTENPNMNKAPQRQAPHGEQAPTTGSTKRPQSGAGTGRGTGPDQRPQLQRTGPGDTGRHCHCKG